MRQAKDRHWCWSAPIDLRQRDFANKIVRMGWPCSPVITACRSMRRAVVDGGRVTGDGDLISHRATLAELKSPSSPAGHRARRCYRLTPRSTFTPARYVVGASPTRSRAAPVLGMRSIIAVMVAVPACAEETALAEDVGRRLADQGAVVICGASAASWKRSRRGEIKRGLRSHPTGWRSNGGHPYMRFRSPRARRDANFLIVRRPTRYRHRWRHRTLSEIALAQRIGKPVVGLHDSFRNAVDMPRVATPRRL